MIIDSWMRHPAPRFLAEPLLASSPTPLPRCCGFPLSGGEERIA
jgi:hypothetical protein